MYLVTGKCVQSIHYGYMRYIAIYIYIIIITYFVYTLGLYLLLHLSRESHTNTPDYVYVFGCQLGRWEFWTICSQSVLNPLKIRYMNEVQLIWISYCIK
jgi:hypothetical protein